MNFLCKFIKKLQRTCNALVDESDSEVHLDIVKAFFMQLWSSGFKSLLAKN